MILTRRNALLGLLAAPAIIRPAQAQLEACLPAFCGANAVAPCSQFTIPTTSGLVAWIDACDPNNFVISSTIVQHAQDLSSNHYDFTAGVVGPGYIPTGLNGRPTLLFNGANTLQSLNYATAALGSGNTLTIFTAATLGVDTDSFHGNGPLMNYTASGAASAYDNPGSFGLLALGTTANLTFLRDSISLGTSVTRDVPMRVIFTLKSDGTKTLYINGVVAATAVGAIANFVSPGWLSMGGSQFDSGFFGGNYVGLVSEWGLYSTFADTTAVGLLDTYLKNKWGM